MAYPVSDTENGVAPTNAVLEWDFDETGATEPCTVEELKSFARIDGSSEDALIADLGVAARQLCETYANISIVERTVNAVVNNSLGGVFLPFGPITGDVTVYDESDNEVTATITGVKNKRIEAPNYTYLKAEYTAGYSEVPKAIKTAVLNWFAYLYSERGDTTNQNSLIEAKKLLKPYRR